MVAVHLADSNLRDQLLIKKYNPNDKFRNLYDIAKQLEAIHKLNLVHGDFHDGDILCVKSEVMISDFGLCKPNMEAVDPKDVRGVIPYMAPEVIRCEPYTKAADIYSFGIIMWEMTSGVPAFIMLIMIFLI
jgi:serine/threonine protein kinase